ncbi:MAG: FAD-dependent oxidoreductase [Prolixibacteraceae bacterium]|nr:FAD-dependent oxidoreductase [Prolixibacteraceae bacterium]
MKNPDLSYDVIVVGAGGSGLAAAVSAAENGLSVLVLEKQPELGGSTGIAIGSFTASRTRYQYKAGIEDTPSAHNEDAGKFPTAEEEKKCNYDLRGFFLTNAADTMEWLISKGITFYGPSPEPPNRVPRMHNVVPNAKAYIAILQAELLRNRGTIFSNATVLELVLSDGRVTGVLAEIKGNLVKFEARRGVVLAAGGYTNNTDMITWYKGDDKYNLIEGINPHEKGDGHRLAQAIGAKLVNMELTYRPEIRFVPPSRKPFSQILPSTGGLSRLMGMMLPVIPRTIFNAMIKRLLVTWQHPENSLFDNGAILVNRQGKRFCNETLCPDREIAISHQPDKIAFIVLDERLIKLYSEWPHYISTAPEVAYAYVQTYLKLRSDVSAEGNSIEDAAMKRKLPVATLKSTIESFNHSVDCRMNDTFRGHVMKYPFENGRTVILGPVKAYFTSTGGGVSISEKMEVLDKQNRHIPGLYAAGQNGLGGQVLWGHGLSIAWALTSGRLVGKELAMMNQDSN